MNANTYFNNARGGSDKGFTRPLYRFNYYGWDWGGRALPGHKDDRRSLLRGQEYYSPLVPRPPP